MCIECHDTGYVEDRKICNMCAGSGEGYNYGTICQECKGEGELDVEEECKCLDEDKEHE